MHLIYSLEDDQDISKIIHVSLTKAGYEVKSFDTAHGFLVAFEENKPDMAILDLMLPDGNGMDVLRKIRSEKSNDEIHVLILSAKHDTMDKVEGLDLGADDYIEKPFNILELISRVNVRFRNDNHLLSYGDVSLDVDSRKVRKGNQEVILTNMEFEILRILLQSHGKVISREEIYKKLYHEEAVETRAIDMHVVSLRKKLGDQNSTLIRTLYGIGYTIG